MPTTPSHATHPLRAALCAAPLALACGVLVSVLFRDPPAAAGGPESALYAVESDGLRYEFNAVLGTESLRRADEDGARNLARERPEDLVRLRSVLLDELGVRALETLRARHRRMIRVLADLGYV